MFIGAGGNSDDQMDKLAWVPGHAGRELQHSNPGMVNQLLIAGQAVGDGNAVAKIGVGDLLTLQHTVNVACLDAATAHQEVARLANGSLFVLGLRLQPNLLLSYANHRCLQGERSQGIHSVLFVNDYNSFVKWSPFFRGLRSPEIGFFGRKMAEY